MPAASSAPAQLIGLKGPGWLEIPEPDVYALHRRAGLRRAEHGGKGARTVPARNASPERPPLSESKMKMVAVSGTLPSAAATASGTR